MKITAIETMGIGGLTDGRLTLPDSPVLALAGGNGTGKSKLLACLLALWSNALPIPSDASARVAIDITLSEEERTRLGEFARQLGYSFAEVPDQITVTITHDPLKGTERTVEPDPHYFFSHLWTGNWPNIMQQLPSLEVVYLPAERRLVDSGNATIDLGQLREDRSLASIRAPRDAVRQYGRLDDSEFENYARALCVAATLPDDPESTAEERSTDSKARWRAFRETVNGLLEPKSLLDLTAQNSDRLLVKMPDGGKHPVSDLSSGERQALIIISRVLRAGSEQRLVLIDEPDAYLHPHLSRRLIQALENGIGASGHLIVATHSPAILDSLPLEAIVRLGHGVAPQVVTTEEARIDLYRTAGFRSSALTQSDLLVAVEGVGDSLLLQLLMPELARATLLEAGGRSRVINKVDSLLPHDPPVLGLVDGDVDAPPIPASLSEFVSVLPVADMEAVFLSDEAALETMIERGLIRQSFATVPKLRVLLADLMEAVKDNVIAEIAQRSLRLAPEWPKPRGQDPLTRLKACVTEFVPPTLQDLEDAIAHANERWEATTGQDRWTLVRGKYVLGQFVSRATHIRDAPRLLEIVARAQPELSALGEFRARVARVLR